MTARPVATARPCVPPLAAPPSATAVLADALRRQWRPIVAASVLITSWQVCEALVPVAIGVVVDRAISTGDRPAMAVALVGLLVLFVALAGSFRFGSRLSRWAREHAAHRTRQDLSRTVLDPRAAPRTTRRHGETLWTLNEDADRLGGAASVLPDCCGAVAAVLAAAVLLLHMSWPLGLVVLVGCPVLLWLVSRLGKPLAARAATEQATGADATAVATDLLGGLRVLKGFGGEAAAVDRYVDVSRRSLHATLGAARAEALYDAITVGATLAFLAVVTGVGGRLATTGEISVGELVAALGLSQFLLGPLGRLAHAGGELARVRASADRVADVLHTPHRADGALRLPADARGALDVRDGSLALHVPAGALVGVVADTAEAARLVRRLSLPGHSPDLDVRIDGVDVAALAAAEWRRTLLVARHDEELFSQSVWDNVAADGADSDQVRRAMAAARATQVVETLPAGVLTVLAERGRSLSGGQRQRIALARALAADPLVLVLHDPTTAVDTATGTEIARGLRDLRAGRTTVVVASDPVLLDHCDHVVLVTDGRVDAAGTHADLVRLPDYRRLVLL